MESTVSVDWALIDEDDDAAVSLQMAMDFQAAQADQSSSPGNPIDQAPGALRPSEAAVGDEGGDGSDEVEDDEVEEEGEPDDECEGYQRGASHELLFETAPTGSADWTIGRILKRRRPKAHELRGEERYDPDYAGDLETVGEWMLLVEWAGQPATQTWERRGWLLDQGYGDVVRAFEQELSGTRVVPVPKKKERKQPPQFYYPYPYGAPLDDEAARQYKDTVQSLVKELRLREAPLWDAFQEEFRMKILQRPHLGSIFSATRFPTNPPYAWAQKPFGERTAALGVAPLEKYVDPNEVAPALRLAAWWKNDGLVMTQLCPIGESETLSRFFTRYVESGRGTPIISLCHGTQRKFAPRIASAGLRVPGERGVFVVNGSAYGVGIYSTCAPSYASGYARPKEHGVIFICAGMCMDIPEINAGGRHVYVYYRSELIVPILAARFEEFNGLQITDYAIAQQKYTLSETEREKHRYPPPKIFESLEEMLNAPNGLPPADPTAKAKVEDSVRGHYKAPVVKR